MHNIIAKFRLPVVSRKKYESVKAELYRSQCKEEAIWQIHVFAIAGYKNKIAVLTEENENLKKQLHDLTE